MNDFLGASRTWVRRNVWFVIGVVLPVIVVAIYYFAVASGQYVSESRFVIKSPNQRSAQVSTIASLIQTTGLSAGQEQANEVMDYVRSRSALRDVMQRFDLRQIYGRSEIDRMARYPMPFKSDLNENLYEYYKGKVDISLDHDSGLIVLRTLAFTAQDARTLNEQLLRQSETLVNDLNNTAQNRSIAEAEQRVLAAQDRVSKARQALARYRDSVLLVDPGKQATGVLEIVNRLVAEKASLQAQLNTVERLTPRNPMIPALRQKISSLDGEITRQTRRAVGGSGAISRKLPPYESLELEQEFASQVLLLASTSLEQARVEAARQQFYLERVVDPGLPDKAEFPHSLRIVLTVLGALLCLYFILWMFVVGILEHAPED